MTTKPARKMHGPRNWALALARAAGALEGLLLARLLARLLAARPDNPSIELLYRISGPLVAPLAGLDLGQRQYGAVLELSTTTLAIIVPPLAYLAWAWLGAASQATSAGRPSS
jgi:hypothetical protein